MRFNKTEKAPAKTVNLAGGQAFTESAKLELASILLTSFVSDQYYRAAGDAKKPAEDTTLGRVVALLDKTEPLFAAKAAVYARNEFGMRSITHVVAAELAKRVKGAKWTRAFYTAVCRRPDDAVETAAYYLSKYGKRLPNALTRGLATALGKFDAYQLGRYRAEGKALSLVDLVNLVHPKPTDGNREALAALVKGELKSTDWQARLTAAGQQATTEEEKAELKGAAWKDLLETRKLGLFAAIRNIRNILEQAPDCVDALCDYLVDERLIRKSLVLPFRYMTALEEVEKLPGSAKVLAALSKAADIACANAPKFEGKTLVALDCSGSMQGRPAEIARLFAAVLLKTSGADLIEFASEAAYKSVNIADAVLTIAKQIGGARGGTNFHAIFVTAQASKRCYDRILILSDMQAWMGHTSPTKTFEAYKQAMGCNPKVFSWDLAGYGSLQCPEDNVFALAGFSDKALELVALLESDRKALVHKIESVEF